MATIIKHNSQVVPSGKEVRSVAYNLVDIEVQADARLETFRQEATRIIHEAKQEGKAIRQRAEESGRRAALDAAEKLLDERIAKQMATLTPALQEVVRQVEDAKQAWMQHWESAAIALATAIAERLVRSELTRRPEIPLEWIREALSLAAGSENTTLRLHPEDESTLRSQVQMLQEVFAPVTKIRIAADPSISLGGCRVETQFGSVDHQLETQLQRIRDELG
jgi:flagellar assembly protein FliH